MTYVTYEKRVISYLIDFLIAFAVACILTFVGNIHLTFHFIKYVHETIVLTSICYLVISIISLLLFKGATIGRLIVRLKLVDVDDSEIRFGQIIIRSLMECLIGFGFMNLVYQILYHSKDSIFDRATHTKIKF